MSTPDTDIDRLLNEILATHVGCLDCAAGVDHNGPRFASVGEAYDTVESRVAVALSAIESGDDDWQEKARACLPVMREFTDAVRANALALLAEPPPKPRPWWKFWRDGGER